MRSPKDKKAYKVLLLTNKDSDNLGDQVIEACDISLISAVMKNLDIGERSFLIKSRPASIVSQKYLATRDPDLLKRAEKLIREADLVVFGGAPMFNYRYQVFSERTAATLEIAEKYGTPVIFSAIGVEGYDEHNKKCQNLKKALNYDCVKQITTRDDFNSLEKFKEKESLILDKVADPAVFASQVFKSYITKKKAEKKRIGIFVLRANGFKDNHVDFSKEDAAQLWKALTVELEKRGYDYELVTSGHFGDEAFLDRLIRNYGMKSKKCVFNMNSPEQLIEKISSYDAVVSTRLHPSIISFSLDVPSVGIVWNSKVEQFYRSIGYEDRQISVKGITSEKIIEKIEGAITGCKEKDEAYLISVYHSLFYGIKSILAPDDNDAVPYEYTELVENIPPYKGTSEKEMEEKLRRKFRRAYGKYNESFEKNLRNKQPDPENLKGQKPLKKYIKRLKG